MPESAGFAPAGPAMAAPNWAGAGPRFNSTT